MTGSANLPIHTDLMKVMRKEVVERGVVVLCVLSLNGIEL